jgi:hypothetical protein
VLDGHHEDKIRVVQTALRAAGGRLVSALNKRDSRILHLRWAEERATDRGHQLEAETLMARQAEIHEAERLCAAIEQEMSGLSNDLDSLLLHITPSTKAPTAGPSTPAVRPTQLTLGIEEQRP